MSGGILQLIVFVSNNQGNSTSNDSTIILILLLAHKNFIQKYEKENNEKITILQPC